MWKSEYMKKWYQVEAEAGHENNLDNLSDQLQFLEVENRLFPGVKRVSSVSVPSWWMMDATLQENANLVSSQCTEEKQSLVQMNTGTSGNVDTQYDNNKKGKIGYNVAKDLLNNQVSAAVCWVPSWL